MILRIQLSAYPGRALVCATEMRAYIEEERTAPERAGAPAGLYFESFISISIYIEYRIVYHPTQDAGGKNPGT